MPGARLGGGAGDRHGARARRRRRRARRRAAAAPAGRRRPRRLHAHRRAGGRSAAFGGRILNTHPSLLPAFPGAHAVRDALAQGVKVTGATVHLVDATLDGGPIVAQEAVAILPADDEATLHDADPGRRASPPAAGRGAAPGGGVGRRGGRGRTVAIDVDHAEHRLPVPRRALLSVSDKTGLAELGAGSSAAGFELVSTGGTARALRESGLPVTDVAAVTGAPEMLDGRVKTLHPRIHAGILADRRLEDHRRQLVAAAIAPFELVVVNLYPFAAAADRPGITFDELVEEIDIGGPSMVRAAAKNHASVAIVTSPDRYPAILEAVAGGGSVARACGPPWRSRRSATPRPTTPGSPPSCRARMAAPASTCPTSRGCPARAIRSRRA